MDDLFLLGHSEGLKSSISRYTYVPNSGFVQFPASVFLKNRV